MPYIDTKTGEIIDARPHRRTRARRLSPFVRPLLSDWHIHAIKQVGPIVLAGIVLASLLMEMSQ